MLEQYLDAHNELSIQTSVARKDVKNVKFARSKNYRDIMRCFAKSNGRNYRVANCPAEHQHLEMSCLNVFAGACTDSVKEQDVSVDDKELLKLGVLWQKSITDVC